MVYQDPYSSQDEKSYYCSFTHLQLQEIAESATQSFSCLYMFLEKKCPWMLCSLLWDPVFSRISANIPYCIISALILLRCFCILHTLFIYLHLSVINRCSNSMCKGPEVTELLSSTDETETRGRSVSNPRFFLLCVIAQSRSWWYR
jgi:hypothetical protein